MHVQRPRLPLILAFLGVLVFMFQVGGYSHTLDSNLDEGAYLLKGLLTVSGEYQLYQADGFWSNHMPLAFLIPGMVQKWFTPGLESGRSFMVLLALLTILGTWLVSRRLTGNWLAAGAIWVYALNPVVIKMYSTAVSQGLVACLLVWVLVLSLGKRCATWQILLGSALASVVVMTRVNMLPLLPLLILYLFWEHGRIIGLAALLTSSISLVLLHVPFYPGILSVWAGILPNDLTPFLDAWRPRLHATPFLSISKPLADQVYSVARTLRFHFIPISGALLSWLFVSSKASWASSSERRVFIFLSMLFASLLAIHAWAVLVLRYCLFCLEGYLAFFSISGVLVMILSARYWVRHTSLLRQILIILVILLLSTAGGYAGFEELPGGILFLPLPRALLEFNPSSHGWLAPWQVITNKFLLESATIRRLDAPVTGFTAGLLILAITFAVRWLITRWRAFSFPAPSFAYLAAAIFLIAGGLLSPTPLLGNGRYNYDCGGNQPQSYRAVGEHLAEIIPPGSKVYWRGGDSVVPLLYLSGVRLFPAQINGDYSFFIDGDPDTLLKYGLWNQELDQQWQHEADFLLIESRFMRLRMSSFDASQYIEYPPTSRPSACRPGSVIRIFAPRQPQSQP